MKSKPNLFETHSNSNNRKSDNSEIQFNEKYANGWIDWDQWFDWDWAHDFEEENKPNWAALGLDKPKINQS